MAWAEEWAREGVKVDWEKLLPPPGFQVLPRRWVVERTFSWIDQNRRMSKALREELCASGEARSYMLCHESSHGEATSPCLRPFHTVSSRRWVNKLMSTSG
jgi:transposase